MRRIIMPICASDGSLGPASAGLPDMARHGADGPDSSVRTSLGNGHVAAMARGPGGKRTFGSVWKYPEGFGRICWLIVDFFPEDSTELARKTAAATTTMTAPERRWRQRRMAAVTAAAAALVAALAAVVVADPAATVARPVDNEAARQVRPASRHPRRSANTKP